MVDINKIKKEDIEIYIVTGKTYVYYKPTNEIISDKDFMNFIEKNKITNMNEFKIISANDNITSYYINENNFNKLFNNTESFNDKLLVLRTEIDFGDVDGNVNF